MEMVTTVVNPVNGEEIQVTLELNVSVVVTNDTQLLTVSGFGTKDLS